MNVLCIVDWDHQRPEEVIVWNWKTGKLKNKKLSKITITDEKEPSVQSADGSAKQCKAVQSSAKQCKVVQSNASLKLRKCIYQNLDTGYHSI